MSVVSEEKTNVCAYPSDVSNTQKITRNTVPVNDGNPSGEQSHVEKRDLRRGRKRFQPIPVLCG